MIREGEAVTLIAVLFGGAAVLLCLMAAGAAIAGRLAAAEMISKALVGNLLLVLGALLARNRPSPPEA